LPGWQAIYQQLKDKNFEVISVAQDTNGVKDAGPWITAAKPTYTALIDEKHLVSKLYNMVNVPTGVWINEEGRMVRPNEVAFVDDRFKTFTGLDSEPYLTALRDWVEKGEKSAYAMSEVRLLDKLNANDSSMILAAAEFGLGEYLYQSGHLPEAVPHFRNAQRLNPKSWNYSDRPTRFPMPSAITARHLPTKCKNPEEAKSITSRRTCRPQAAPHLSREVSEGAARCF